MKAHKIKSYYALNPVKFRALVEMRFSQEICEETEEMEQCLDIVLAKGSDVLNGERLSLRFIGVRKLSFVQSEMSLVTFSHLEVKEEGLSGFKIKNEEDDLKFLCRDFSFVVSPSSV